MLQSIFYDYLNDVMLSDIKYTTKFLILIISCWLKLNDTSYSYGSVERNNSYCRENSPICFETRVPLVYEAYFDVKWQVLQLD
jgi:hypothetical protein